MNITSAPPQGILVLAGLLDPCADIGSQSRYALLPIPWNRDELMIQVTRMIRCEFQEKEKIEYQATWLPEDNNDLQDLERGIGLIVWFKTKDTSRELINLLNHGWSEKRGKQAAKVIDHLSFNIPPAVVYPWIHDSPDDEIGVQRFESMLFSQLENNE